MNTEAELAALRQQDETLSFRAAAVSCATKLAEAQVQLAVLSAAQEQMTKALNKIADPENPRDPCGCEHDTEDCCALKGDYYCPQCIAWHALNPALSSSAGSPSATKETK